MGYLVNIIFGVIGIVLFVLPLFVWNKNVNKELIDYSVVSKRKKHRRLSVLGLFFVLVSLLTGLDIDGVSFICIVGLIFGDNRCFFEPYFESGISASLERQKFCLFLRPFDTDGNLNFSSFLGLRNTKIEWLICKELNKQVGQTYAIGNPRSYLPTNKNIFNIYATDLEWHDVIHTLSEKSRLIFLRMGETQGCKWEINHCQKKKYFGKMILLIEDINGLLVSKELVGLKTNITTINKPCLAYYDQLSEEWVISVISKKNDIKTFVSKYLKSHNQIEGYIRETKKLSSIPAKLSTALIAYMNPVALVICNNWPLKWKIAGLLYCTFDIIIPVLSLLYVDDEDIALLLALVLMHIVCLPFMVLAPLISRNCYSWGSDIVYKRVNVELCWWMLFMSILLAIISFLQ